MEHRSRVQVDVLGAVGALDHVVLGVGDQVGVAEHHALGDAGRAAGVGDGGDRLGGQLGQRRRLERDQLLVGHAVLRAGAVAEVDEVLEQRAALPQRAGGLELRCVGAEHPRLAVVEHVGELRGRQARVEVVEDAAVGGNPDPALEVAPGVRCQHRDHVARCHGELRQAAAEPTDAARQLAVGDRAGCAAGRDTVAVQARGVRQGPAQRVLHLRNLIDRGHEGAAAPRQAG